MIAYGVLGGLLVAGAALPEAAVAAVALGATGSTYAMLPADLRQPRTAQTSVVYAADGHTPITAFYDENRQDVALAQVAPAMRQAIVAAEDTRFYEHGAVDPRGLARALVVDVPGERPSTLTMQYVRNVAATTPLDLANAYATVASGGVYCKPLPVVSVTDRFGHPVPIGPDCHQAVDPDVAAAAADAARCPVGQQSAYGACDGATAPMVAGIVHGRPVGGKTGSSEWNSTETFVGFTPQIAAAAIAADPADPGDRVGAGVAPEVDAAVARTLARALRGLPYQDFPTPPPRLAGRE